MSHPKALVDGINNISRHPAFAFLYIFIHNYSSGAAVKVNAASPHREADRDGGTGSLYRCAFLQPVEGSGL